jgi:hypothetical protein
VGVEVNEEKIDATPTPTPTPLRNMQEFGIIKVDYKKWYKR